MSYPGRPAGLVSRGPGAGLVLSVLVTVALMAAACGGADATNPWPTPVFVEAITQPPLGSRETAYDPPRPAPALRLTDGAGKPFDLASLRGSPVFVYFGYTHCPDVCPTTLADLRAGIKEAGVDAKVVFVTIDPARDDAAAMKQYTDYYKAGYTGLTGTAEEIAEAAEAGASPTSSSPPTPPAATPWRTRRTPTSSMPRGSSATTSSSVPAPT